MHLKQPRWMVQQRYEYWIIRRALPSSPWWFRSSAFPHIQVFIISLDHLRLSRASRLHWLSVIAGRRGGHDIQSG